METFNATALSRASVCSFRFTLRGIEHTQVTNPTPLKPDIPLICIDILLVIYWGWGGGEFIIATNCFQLWLKSARVPGRTVEIVVMAASTA